MNIIFIVAAVLLVIFILIYNGIIRKKNSVENAMGGMDAYLKQRYDLIPNLVETAKKFMEHEKELLEGIVKLRSMAMDADKSDDIINQNNKISKAIGGLMVQVENYPDMKSNSNFIQVQNTLKDVEENIAASRRYYNTAVTEFNNAIETFPNSIVAGSMGMQRKQVFEISVNERKNVNVKELF